MIMAVVRGECTELVQLPNVSWNAPFLKGPITKYDTWLDSGRPWSKHEVATYIQAASKALWVKWVLEVGTQSDKR